MAKSLSQIQAQIEKLQVEAEALKAKEVDGVVDRIRAAIEHYGLTPQQLFGSATRSPRKGVARKTTARKSKSTGGKVAIKYRYGENTWTGRGNKPRWLVARLAEGKAVEEFLVG